MIRIVKVATVVWFRINPAAYDKAKRNYLSGARKWLKSEFPIGGRATVDAVRFGYGPPPWYLDGRIMGKVFTREGGWVKEDYLPGFRERSHHRPVALFRRVR